MLGNDIYPTGKFYEIKKNAVFPVKYLLRKKIFKCIIRNIVLVVIFKKKRATKRNIDFNTFLLNAA